MPTILYILGWRMFFYANENHEPIHVHAPKGGMECKFWLDVDTFEIREAYSYNLGTKDKREVKKVIYQNFDYCVEEWNRFQSLKK